MNNTTITNLNENLNHITRRIGRTTYRVEIFFKDTGQETMEDKILRIVRNELLENERNYGILEIPQMSRQSERSAS